MRDTIDEKATEFELPEGYPQHIPHFATQEEAGDFWDTHSTAPYFYEGEDVTNNPPPELKRGLGRDPAHLRELRAQTEGVKTRMRMPLISLRMPDEMVAALKEVAARRHLPYQTLMRSWIAERLDQERQAFGKEGT